MNGENGGWKTKPISSCNCIPKNCPVVPKVKLTGDSLYWPKNGHSAGIFLLPVLIQRIRDLRQPRLVLDLLQQFRRGKILDAVRRWIAQLLEQSLGYEDCHIQ